MLKVSELLEPEDSCSIVESKQPDEIEMAACSVQSQQSESHFICLGIIFQNSKNEILNINCIIACNSTCVCS